MVLSAMSIFALVFALPQLMGPPHRTVSVRQPFEEGISGVEAGTPIILGGLTVGNVLDVVTVAAAGSEGSYFRVDCSVDASLVIPRTAKVKVVSSMIGGASSLAIELPTHRGQPALGADEMLATIPHTDTLESLLGKSQADQLRAAVERNRALDFRTPIRDGVERLRTIQTDVNAVWAEYALDAADWTDQSNAILEGLAAAQQRFGEIEGLFAAGATLDRAQLQSAFDRIHTQFAESKALAHTVQQRWTEEVVPPFFDLVERTKKSIALISGNAAIVMTLLRDANAARASTMADMQIAGDQLRRAEQEIIFTPWTLLGGAFADKSEQAEFIKIARELVRSTTELHMAVSFARTILDQDPKLTQRHPELVNLMKQWMSRASAEHEVAGEALLNRLIGVPVHDP